MKGVFDLWSAQEFDESEGENQDPFLFHNTMLIQGSAYAVVCSIGDNTLCARKHIKPRFYRILEEKESVFSEMLKKY